MSSIADGGIGAVFIGNSFHCTFEGYQSFNNALDLFIEAGSTVEMNTQAWGPTRTFAGDTRTLNGAFNTLFGGAPGGASLTVVPPGANASDSAYAQGFAAGSGAILGVLSSGASAPLFIGSKGASGVFIQAPAGTTRVTVNGTGVTLTVPLATSGSILSTGATGGIGYSTGAGGTVTQGCGSGKATGVTLNKATGLITMDAAALAADTTVSFTLTNSAIAATDTLILNHVSGGTAGAYSLNAQVAAGSASINVRNINGYLVRRKH